MPLAIAFDNSYARLPDRFFVRTRPEPAAAPRLIALNDQLARELGLASTALTDHDGLAILSGMAIPEGADPIAMAYAGHQFGNFVPALGDGRALLLGEVIDREGRRRDIQLKGSGRTAFSRRGDGKAALGPVLREYLVSEAMAALGIPTTRALAAVATGAPVFRETLLPGAVITRVALSHIRVGTFQYFASRQDVDALGLLTDYVIARLYPEAAEAPQPVLALFTAICRRQAELIARWLAFGFIHGVMNTDNMAISGETIDYGPCAFMDAYDPAAVFSSIDHGGRYAYGNQPRIAQWNLARLAECLLPLLVPALGEKPAVDALVGELNVFTQVFETAYLAAMAAKLGLSQASTDDRPLIDDWLKELQAGEVDFTLAFRRLGACAQSETADAALLSLSRAPDGLAAWLPRWRARLAGDSRPPDAVAAAMAGVNPAVIPRNHLIEEVIAAAVTAEDYGPFAVLHQALTRPYDEPPTGSRFTAPPLPEQRVTATFCGT